MSSYDPDKLIDQMSQLEPPNTVSKTIKWYGQMKDIFNVAYKCGYDDALNASEKVNKNTQD